MPGWLSFSNGWLRSRSDAHGSQAPAAVRVALPSADLGLCLAYAPGVTFPFNLAMRITLCHALAALLAQARLSGL